MKDFFNWFASFFRTDLPTSISRLIAFIILVVLVVGNWHFWFWSTSEANHIHVLQLDGLFILLLIGIIKVADLLTLRTGVKVTQTETQTPTGKIQSVEKEVSQPVDPNIEQKQP